MLLKAHLLFASQSMDYAGSSTAENSKSKKTDATKIYSKKLTIITRNRVVAKQSRCEGVYNRTGDLSVICFGKEKRRRE